MRGIELGLDVCDNLREHCEVRIVGELWIAKLVDVHILKGDGWQSAVIDREVRWKNGGLGG